ncbi:HAD-IIA family hydrolase [Paenarthrobacter ilicis]|uniref:HAD-IIA family hydrolase n=1 Tax=Paenarthrobacter ilicis TaxID=43665 RepID=UPI0028D02613|nr:HAD-IIA family hydrolase [Paenarthrobacter ilicis]
MTDALISSFDAVLSDLDGVVYAGPHAIPGAVESLRRLSTFGVGLGYVTNNASRTPAQVAEHLRELGAPAEDHQVVSSSQAAGELLASMLPSGARVLITGSAALAQEIELAGLTPVHSAEENPVAVVQGFNPEIGWKDLAEASYVVAGGASWFATNTDMSIPQARGIAPGNGTLVAAVAAATGKKPMVAGKPEAPLFHTAAKRLGSDRPLVVGDRLDTDILGGNRAGFATAAVLTGVDTTHSILAARTAERPTYLLADLEGLYAPYPEIVDEGGTFRCGQAEATAKDGLLVVVGDSNDLDAWRAACAAWWAAVPETDVARTPELDWQTPPSTEDPQH